MYVSSTGSAGLGVVLFDLDNTDDARFMAGHKLARRSFQWMQERKQQVKQLFLIMDSMDSFEKVSW